MFRLLRAVSLVALVLACAAPASAELTLTIQNGRVTLEARDVTVRQILAEWSRLGQTRIVNGDKVPGGTVTLKLVNMPETQALDILLRGVGGYMAAPRPVQIAAASNYDRILILATSTPPPPSAQRPVTSPMPVQAMPFPFPGPPATDDTNNPGDPGDPPDNMRMTPRPAFPGPAQPMPQPYPGIPGAMPAPTGAENPAAGPTPASVFPAGTSPVPGVVIQPQPQPGQRPAQPQRPPVP